MESFKQTTTGLLTTKFHVCALFLILISMSLFPLERAQAEKDERLSELELAVASVISASEKGDFESALDSYRRGYQLAFSAHAEEEFWKLCSLKCPPYIGQLGWLVGASASDFRVLKEATNEIEDDAQRDVWRDHLERFALAHLGQPIQSSRRQENTLPLYFLDDALVDRRPWTPIRAGNSQSYVWAIIDTGRALVYFEQHLAEKESFQYRVVRDIFSTEEWDGRPVRLRHVVVENLTLEYHFKEPLLGGMYDSKTPVGLRGTMALGTLPLLRHGAVCFDWESRVLHLGYLGPCSRASRIKPFKAWLQSHSLIPHVEVRRNDGSSLIALIDTGADPNLCKTFASGEEPQTHLSFGEHPSLNAACTPGEARIIDDHVHDMVIGMETLSQFSAFGWELNPFQMYFVPKSESEASGTSFLERTIAELKASAQQGDFEGALTAQWRALRYSLAEEGPAWNEYQALCTDVCTFMGQLAWLTGATASEFEFLNAYVRDIGDEELRESWREWVYSILFGHLGEVNQPARNSATILSLIPANNTSRVDQPRTLLLLPGFESAIEAAIDTGTSVITFSEAFAEEHSISSQVLTEYSNSQEWDGKEKRTRAVSLDSVTLEGQYQPLPLAFMSAGTNDGTQELTLGNRPLLRHDAICFAWEEGKLYLGESGPCNAADRVSASGSLLHPQKLVPMMQFETDGPGDVRALLSTGSPSNRCKAEMAGLAFTLGNHELLTVRCDANAEPITDDYEFDMIIGMETLAEFSAFGWELNPFRTYFVPRSSQFE